MDINEKKYNCCYLTIVFCKGRKYYYVGKHSTDNLNDGYHGSGKVIKIICKKYPYKTRIVSLFKDELSAYEFEEILVEKAKSKWGKSCLNFAVGGKGRRVGTKLSKSTKIKMSIAKKGLKWTDTAKAQRVEYFKSRSHWLKGRKQTEEHKSKVREAVKGKMQGFKHSEESIAKMSSSKIGDKNPMYGKTSGMKGKPAGNRNASWDFDLELREIWDKNNCPSAYIFKNIAVSMGYPDCSYRGIISSWQKSISTTVPCHPENQHFF